MRSRAFPPKNKHRAQCPHCDYAAEAMFRDGAALFLRVHIMTNHGEARSIDDLRQFVTPIEVGTAVPAVRGDHHA